MPTTCGFPNCKFRSRYRGQEDNRHFYRIPKRPQVLRQRWLEAIGRTEETVVSQVGRRGPAPVACLPRVHGLLPRPHGLPRVPAPHATTWITDRIPCACLCSCCSVIQCQVAAEERATTTTSRAPRSTLVVGIY
uniref:THAP-type domain-containing protein n=1 Tax=Plectus sambesii TaxID=2011161 RepID=A0A914UKL6_9BILA